MSRQNERQQLEDGRRVHTDNCLGIEDALAGTALWNALEKTGEDWFVRCFCCEGSGEHSWSPSGYSVDPDGGVYACTSCYGMGQFYIETHRPLRRGDAPQIL